MSDNMPRVAVLMAAYNGMAFIEEQLQSIEQQESVDVSLFISVDISSDGTYEWCCEYAQQCEQVTVLPYGDKFEGAAANFFHLINNVDFSGFDYVALADQDDIWLENKLTRACQQLNKNKFDGYSSNVLAFWDNGREILIDKAQRQKKYDYLFEAAGPGCTYVLTVSALMVFKKIVMAKPEQIKQIALHDWLIYAFFRSKKYQWFIDSAITMRYRQHQNNQVGVNKGWQAYLNRFQLLRSGWYKQQVIAIAELIEEREINIHSRWALLSNINQLRRHWLDRVILFYIVLFRIY